MDGYMDGLKAIQVSWKWEAPSAGLYSWLWVCPSVDPSLGPGCHMDRVVSVRFNFSFSFYIVSSSTLDTVDRARAMTRRRGSICVGNNIWDQM